MRLAGHHPCACVTGIANQGLGALDANLQNPLYAPGTPNSHYNDVIAQSTWDVMRGLATAYPSLPYGGEGMQNPWGTTGGTYYKEYAQVSASGGGGGPRESLKGLGYLGAAELTDPFPYRIKDPFITGNNFWYTGQPTLNIGSPRFSNDAMEFLRSALVDSDWDRVEAWMGWALRNGLTASKLPAFDFGKWKYTAQPNGTKKSYPFSREDIRTFYERFLRFSAQSAPADRACIQSRFNNAMRAVDSGPRNQFVLRLADCPLTQGWEQGLLKAVAVIAIPMAIATAATAIAAYAGTTAGATGAAGAGTGAAAGTGVAAGSAASVAATAVPVGIETVTVAASALPALGAGTAVASAATAIAAGTVIATATPPPIAAPEIAAPTSIETVTVTATPIAVAPLVPIVTAGTAIGAGTIIATASPPPPLEPVIETVTVEAPVETVQIDPLEAAVIGTAAIAITAPVISVPEPTLPEVDTGEPSLTDRISTGLQDAVASVGGDLVMNELEQYLQDLLGRPPTPTEVDQWGDWVSGGGSTAPPTVSESPVEKVIPWILGAVIAYAIYEYSRKKKRKKSRSQ